jgi:hypothetical protein
MAVKYSRYKFAAESLLKRLRNGRFASETSRTAVSGVKRSPGSKSGLKQPLGLPKSSMFNSFSRRVRCAMGVVIEMCVKCLGGWS